MEGPGGLERGSVGYIGVGPGCRVKGVVPGGGSPGVRYFFFLSLHAPY